MLKTALNGLLAKKEKKDSTSQSAVNADFGIGEFS